MAYVTPEGCPVVTQSLVFRYRYSRLTFHHLSVLPSKLLYGSFDVAVADPLKEAQVSDVLNE